MAGRKLRHKTAGVALEKTEWEDVDFHLLVDQAKGDLIIATSPSVLEGLAITDNRILVSSDGLPLWGATLPSFALAASGIITIPANGRIRMGDTNKQVDIIPWDEAAVGGILVKPYDGNKLGFLAIEPEGTSERSQLSLYNSDRFPGGDYSVFNIEVNGDTVVFIYEDSGTPLTSIAHLVFLNIMETISVIPRDDRFGSLGSATKRYDDVYALHHQLTQALNADHRWSGVSATMTAGEALTRPEAVYVKNDGKMWKAKANAEGTMPAIALVTLMTHAQNAEGEFLLQGFFRDDTWDWTPGGILYIDEDTAGVLTQTAPAGAGEQVQVAGVAITADIIYFNPSLELVEIS